MKKKLGIWTLAAALTVTSGLTAAEAKADEGNGSDLASMTTGGHTLTLEGSMPRFTYDSGLNFSYPEEGVKGIYVTGHSAGGDRMDKLINLVDSTDLNAMVIDIKDDHGNLTFSVPEGSDLPDIGKNMIKDPEALMKKLEKHDIYPIARITTFKDNVLAEKHPEYSYQTSGGDTWSNGSGHMFTNPFMKEVWDYNLQIAEEAARLGFQDIQFDYIRFPEGFETRDDQLTYSTGDYDNGDDNVQERVDAVTDFVAHSEETLQTKYNVNVSADIFGYSATQERAPGIGQDFRLISENVDVISSMIYPSHWGSGYFNIDKPDTKPYEVIDAYAKAETKILSSLDDQPITRPWIQDFTASYLGSGNYLQYGSNEVEAQIEALQDNGIEEYLLWDAQNSYSKGTDYTP